MEVGRKILCIIAGQRAGTTALQSAISSTGRFFDFGEIFQTGDDRKAGAFLDYARDQHLQIADFGPLAMAEKNTCDYLEYLREIAGPNKFALIDVKLNSWGAIRPFWSYSHQEPVLISILKRQNSRFIFVARKDLVGQVLSESLARRAGKWHQLSDDEIPTPFRFDPALAANQARMITLAEQTLYGFLRHSQKVLPIWYEDLYVDGAIVPKVKDWINANFGLSLAAPPRPAIEKNRVSKEEKVSNFDEVKTAIESVVSKYGRVVF